VLISICDSKNTAHRMALYFCVIWVSKTSVLTSQTHYVRRPSLIAKWMTVQNRQSGSQVTVLAQAG
jgi:hypothetical protein